MKKISSLAQAKQLAVTDLEEILDAKCNFYNTEAESIRDYFYELLQALWIQGEGFSGKRPFGNSGWECNLYHSLVRIGAIAGKLDEYDYAYDYNKSIADYILSECINVIFYRSK